jgi:hypothetical protein
LSATTGHSDVQPAADCCGRAGRFELESRQFSANAIAQFEQDATILVQRNPNLKTTISSGARQYEQTSIWPLLAVISTLPDI